MTDMRSRLRGIAEALLVGAQLPALGRRYALSAPLILAYHNVVSDATIPHGDRSLHLSLADFASHLDLIQRYFEVVPVSGIRDPANDLDRPRVVITFDDAYAGAVRNALPLLASAKLPVTVFVAPYRLGNRSFWWDAVHGPGGVGPTAKFRSHVLVRLRGREEEARDSAGAFGLKIRDVPGESLSASHDELVSALESYPLLTLGSHSWSHASLPHLEERDLLDELRLSLSWVSRFRDRGVPWIAYPYGGVSAAVEAAAAAAGYIGGLRIDGGRVTRARREQHTLPRLDVPALVSANGFALRVAGLWRS